MKNNKQLVQALDVWRDTYNPLRGLTMPRAVSLLESINFGTLAEVMWAFDHIEQTDPDLLALVERRITAVEEMDYDIRMASEEKKGARWDKTLAEEQRAYLAAAYEQIDNLNEAVSHMAMATFRKYAFCQMQVGADGLPTHLECLDQWNFARRGRRGPWYWNPEAQSVDWRNLGVPLDLVKDRLIVREVPRYVDRYGMIKYVRANLSEKDWDGFVEIFGYNQTIVILPPDVGQDKLPEYLAAAQAVSQGGEGALPGGSQVEFPNESRGQQPFRPRLEWLQQQLILAGTGGMLTMLTQSGSGTLAGGAHSDTFATLARAEAKRISEVFQRNIDKTLLNAGYPEKPHLAYFQIAANEEQDVGEVVDHADKISKAFPGWTMDQEEFSEKTGYRLVKTAEPPPPAIPVTPAVPDAAADPAADAAAKAIARLQARDGSPSAATTLDDAAMQQLIANGTDAAIEADRADNRPLAERLYGILELENEPDLMRAAMAQLKRDLPALAAQLVAAPALATAIETLLGPAMLNGIATGVVERSQP